MNITSIFEVIKIQETMCEVTEQRMIEIDGTQQKLGDLIVHLFYSGDVERLERTIPENYVNAIKQVWGI